MKNYSASLVVISALQFLITSCSPTFQYGPGNIGTESAVFICPPNKDSISKAHYVSGGYVFNNSKGYFNGEASRYGQALYQFASSGKYFSYAAGAGLFGGSYNVVSFTADPGWKNYYGLQGSMQFAANIPLAGIVNWRILGLRSGFSLENGELFNFRMKYRNYPGFSEYSGERLIGNGGAFSEIMLNYRNFQTGVYYGNTILFNKDKFLGLAASYGFFAGYGNIFLQYRYAGTTIGNQSHSLGLVLRIH